MDLFLFILGIAGITSLFFIPYLVFDFFKDPKHFWSDFRIIFPMWWDRDVNWSAEKAKLMAPRQAAARAAKQAADRLAREEAHRRAVEQERQCEVERKRTQEAAVQAERQRAEDEQRRREAAELAEKRSVHQHLHDFYNEHQSLIVHSYPPALLTAFMRAEMPDTLTPRQLWAVAMKKIAELQGLITPERQRRTATVERKQQEEQAERERRERGSRRPLSPEDV